MYSYIISFNHRASSSFKYWKT